LLLRVAACCSLVQRFAVLQCHGSYAVATYFAVCCIVLQCVAVSCSVLLCVAVCCSVLQCVASSHVVVVDLCICCSVLQCVAVPQRMSQAVAAFVTVCCSVSVDVLCGGCIRCSVLQYVAVMFPRTLVEIHVFCLGSNSRYVRYVVVS